MKKKSFINITHYTVYIFTCPSTCTYVHRKTSFCYRNQEISSPQTCVLGVEVLLSWVYLLLILLSTAGILYIAGINHPVCSKYSLYTTPTVNTNFGTKIDEIKYQHKSRTDFPNGKLLNKQTFRKHLEENKDRWFCITVI